jgi:hypothetical protein
VLSFSDGLSGCVSLFIQPAAYLWGNDRVGGRFRVGPGLHKRAPDSQPELAWRQVDTYHI